MVGSEIFYYVMLALNEVETNIVIIFAIQRNDVLQQR